MAPSTPPFFSASPNARSKSITTADLDTHGVRIMLHCGIAPYFFLLDFEPPLDKPPNFSRRPLC